MTTLHLHASPRPRAHPSPAPVRLRADLAPFANPSHTLRAIAATHDFLVPNPRPDLTSDLQTLRMLEAG